MTEIPQGNSIRRSARLILQRIRRPITGPIHIDLEGDGDQNNAENVDIDAENQNVDNQDIREPETDNEDVGETETDNQDVQDMIIGNQNNVIETEKVALYNSDDDFASPIPWGKGKVKRKLVMETNVDKCPTKKQKRKKAKAGGLQLIDEKTDEDVPEAQRLHDKEAELKGKAKPTKKPNIDDKAERRRGKHKIEERTEIITKEDEIAKIRNSPRVFTDMIDALSDKQEEWVKKAGFEHLLHFELFELPQRLCYKVVEAFNEKHCKLILKKGDIDVTEQAVHDVFGIPCRGKEIKSGKNSRIEERIKTWRAQFPVTEGTNLVRMSDVVDKIKQTGEVDDIFKMNFLVVMTNVLIRSNTNNSVTQTILSLDDELDNCGNYNWAKYLIENLVITKKRWMHTASLFFTGPMIFLLVLYVDRVLFGEKALVRRKFPAFIGWTKDKLKQREVMESEEGAFGSGVLLEVVTAEELEENQRIDMENVRHDIMIGCTKDKLTETEVMEADEVAFGSGVLLEENQRIEREEKNDAGIEKGNAEIEVRDVEHDNGQNPNNGAHKDWWVELNQKAVFLIDANIQFTEAKAEYEIGLANAKALHPNDDNILEIEKKIKDLFKSNKWMDSESYEDDVCKNDILFPNQDDEVVVHTVDVVENSDAVENSELPPDHDDYLDIIAWLKSPEGMLEIEKDFEDQYIPSFSLGVSQICKEVMEEHGRDDDKNDADDNRTPVPPKEQEKRTKRNVKVGPAFRSPYIERNIDINSSYSNQEIAVYRWMIQEKMNDMEHIFVYGKHTVIRELFKTLIPGQKLSYGIINVWSILMNDRENYKSTEAPMRLYMDIDVSLAPLDERNTKEVQYELFKSEMNHYFERYPNRKMESSNLVFFPILAYEHMYLVSFNLKKKAFDVIDNIRRGRTVGKEYGPKPKLLHQHFVKYLMESKLELMANSLKAVKPNYMVMPWQTLNNYKDCGIFLMRHMETYKGDQNAWITDLKTESVLQKTQLIRLRAKYAHAILASPLNEKRKQIINEAKVLYNKMTSEKVMSIVLAASEGKKVAVRGKKEIKGKVLFGEDDTPEVDN